MSSRKSGSFWSWIRDGLYVVDLIWLSAKLVSFVIFLFSWAVGGLPRRDTCGVGFLEGYSIVEELESGCGPTPQFIIRWQEQVLRAWIRGKRLRGKDLDCLKICVNGIWRNADNAFGGRIEREMGAACETESSAGVDLLDAVAGDLLEAHEDWLRVDGAVAGRVEQYY